MKYCILFLTYIALSLYIGRESHPFSTFPMYNSFPNWGYVFFLKNEKGDILPYGKIFPNQAQKNSGNVSHSFYSFMDAHKFPYGGGDENTDHLHQAGEVLLNMMLENQKDRKFDFDTLKLFRRYYHVVNGQLNYRDDCIYEANL